MIKYQTLENTSIDVIYHAFMNAFSDYQVSFDLSYEDFQNILLKKGFDASISIGAFDNDILVGFILNGLRMWNQRLTGYDLGTGVIPHMRKQGITSQMLYQVKEVMKHKHIQQYLLEVIQTNTNALHLYQKNGFQIQRELKSYQIKKEDYKKIQKYNIKHVDYFEIKHLQDFWNCQPTWQNSYDSIYVVKENFLYSVVYQNNQIVGYGIVDKTNGEIPQIAVHPQYRNQGIGRSLLTDLIQRTTASQIKILNVEDQSTQQFLNHLDFENYIDQYEMILNL